MDDNTIVDLYWSRSERAISETDKKYGGYCYSIAYNVLANREDAEESVNDTYMTAWENLPPNRPSVLGTFLGKITRNIAINRWRSRHAAKRGRGEITLVLDELENCVAGGRSAESEYLYKQAIRSLRGFLDALPETERRVFLRRYWAMDPIGQIAGDFGFTPSKVKSMLYRTRKKLRTQFEKEGIA